MNLKSPEIPSPNAPLIHIGYHKTGTTWLQQHLFVNAQSGFTTPFNKSDDVAEYIVTPNSFDFKDANAREYMEPVLAVAAASGLLPVITSERLSGSPHSGGFDSKELADRLHSLFPDGRVLIVIREKKSMILSTYKQYVKGGGIGSIRSYLHPPRPAGGKKRTLFSHDHFKYHRLIGYYQQQFGHDKVLVLPYEMFCRTPQQFVDAITDFAGAKRIGSLPYSDSRNAATSPFTTGTMRRLNFIGRRTQLNPVPLIESHRVGKAVDNFLSRCVLLADKLVPATMQQKIHGKMKTRIAQMTAERFQESNRLTAEMTGLDLESFGYDV